jgi:predicted NBD/HSP70 family sugar kinase
VGTVRGVNAESARRVNLSLVLTQAHQLGAVTRAQLTHTTGLNRSTIGALVGELADRGLVVESEPPATKAVGRPSPVVRPHPDVVAFAVNPELDALSVGMVGLHGQVVARRRRELDRAVSVDEAARLAADLVREIRTEVGGSLRPVGIGIAVPGLVRASDGLVRWAPHLGWTDAPLTELVSTSTGLPAFAGNDATLGAVAERIFGAARGVDDLIYLNGGASGVGGGVIVAGRPLMGVDGYAGEFGHHVPGRHRPDSGDNPELEEWVSRSRLLAVLGLTAATPEELDAALRSSVAGPVLRELATQRAALSSALAQAVNIFNPEMVVLGGFLGSILATDPGAMARLVRQWALAAPYERVTITAAGLGADLLLVGAAELAFAPLLADPGAPAFSAER